MDTQSDHPSQHSSWQACAVVLWLFMTLYASHSHLCTPFLEPQDVASAHFNHGQAEEARNAMCRRSWENGRDNNTILKSCAGIL